MKYLFAMMVCVVGFIEFLLRMVIVLFVCCAIIGLAWIFYDPQSVSDFLRPNIWDILERMSL